jgi:predicted phosphodiesterase
VILGGRKRPDPFWTAARDARLRTAHDEEPSWDAAVARLGREFGVPLTRNMCRARWQRLSDTEQYIPIDVDLTELPQADTETPGPVLDTPSASADPIAADRTYVERPTTSYRWDPLDCGAELERMLFVPDTHAPHEDKRAWDAVMAYARRWEPHTVVHVGDWVDCFTVSDHDKDPRRGSQLEDEIRVMHGQRQEIDAMAFVQRKFCALGNHEYRLQRYCMRNAPALISLLDIGGLMGLPQAGWSVVPYMQHGKIGKLRWTHGTRHSGAYATHQNGAAFSASVLFGHTHRLGSTYFGDVDGNRHVSASLGWLGDLREANYVDDVAKRFWSHGFGAVTMDRAGRFELQLIPIIEGKTL